MQIITYGPQQETHFGDAFLWVIDELGIKWIFHRTAIMSQDDTFDLNQLNPDEIFMRPGIIYRPALNEGVNLSKD